jgi:hypothetical protein
MGMAQSQDVPFKKDAPSEWSVRRLFPLGAVSSALSKTFTTSFDVMTGFSLFIIGTSELFGRHVSWGFYILTALLVLGAFVDRRANAIKAAEPKKEK